MALGRSRSRGAVARRRASALAADPLERFQAGLTVGGLYDGYKVAHVVYFNGTLATDLIRPGNPYGRFANNFSERDRRKSSPTSVGTVVDRYYTGDKDAGDGVAISSFSDILDVTGGVLVMKLRHATTPEIALTGPRTTTSGPAWTDRRMAWAAPTFLAHFASRGPRIVEIRWRFNVPFAGNATPSNPGMGIWELNVRGGSEQGSVVGIGEINDEFDWIEYHISGGQYNSRYAYNQNDFGAQPPLIGTWQTTRCTYTETSIVIQKISDTGAVLATNTAINSAKNLTQLFYCMFGVFNQTVSGSAFDDAAWASATMTLEVAAIRVLTPLAAETLVPLLPDATPLVMALGDTPTLTLPSQLTLWGKPVDGEYLAWNNATDTNGPGRPAEFTATSETRDALPVGVTYDGPSRTLSFGAGFSTKPGLILLYVYPYTSTSGVSRPYRQAIYVKPKLALPALPAVTPGGAYSTTIPRVDGSGNRYWDNGNVPLGTGHGLSLVTKPSWLSFDPTTRVLSGTAPGNFATDSLTWRCTNGAGHTTDLTQTIATVAQTPINQLAGYVFSWDTTDTNSAPDDGSGKVQFLRDPFDVTKSIGRTLSTGRPAISAVGGPGGNKRVLTFSTSAGQYLRSTEGGNAMAMTTLGSNANIQASASIIYICAAVKADAAGVQRFFGWFRNDNYIQYRHGGSDRGVSYQSVALTTGSVVQATQDNSWHVVELLKNGTAVTSWVDGVQIATGTITITGALSTTDFLVGANYSGSTLTAGLNGQIGPGWAGSTVPTTADQNTVRQWVAAKMGISVATS